MIRLLSESEIKGFFGSPSAMRAHGISDLGLSYLLNSHLFVGTFVEGSLIASTGFKDIGNETLEVHTYVAPEYRRDAVRILNEHVFAFKRGGYKKLTTTATPIVRNFLIKRMGFKGEAEHLEKLL